MIRHIVWWTLKPAAEGKTAEDNARQIQEASATLGGIATARSVDVSTKIQVGTTVPCQLVLVSTHDSLAALEAYKNDPIHVKFAALIAKASDSRNCIDYEIE